MAAARKAPNTNTTFTSFPAMSTWVDLAAIAGILACGFSLAALAGWHIGDPTAIEPGTGRVENWCGPVGALLSDALYAAVGWGAWFVVVPGGLLGLKLAGRDVGSAVRGAGWTALYVTGLGGLHLLFRPGTGFPPGGVAGWAVGEGLEAVVGPIGAWFGVGGSALILVTALFRIDWGAWLGVAVDKLEAGLPVARDWSVAGAGALARIGVQVGTRSLKIVGFGAKTAGRSVGNGFGGVGGAVRRMGESLIREDEPVPALRRATQTGASYLEEDGGGEVPVDATAHGAGAVVVAEVEWEPTAVPRDNVVLDMFPELGPRPTKSDPGPLRAVPLPVKSAKKPAVKVPAVAPVPVAVEVDEDEDEEDIDEDDEDLDEDDLDEDDDDDLEDEDEVDEDEDDEDEDDDEVDENSEDASEVDPMDPPTPVRLARENAVVVHKNPLMAKKSADDGKAITRDRNRMFEMPPLALLDAVPEQKAQFDEAEMRRVAALVEEKLLNFKIGGSITAVRPGPVVTILEFVPDAGIKVSRIAALSDDLAMALKAEKVRIVAPIPGRGAVGIEIPSPKRLTIYFRDVIASDVFRTSDKVLPIAIGKDSEGRVVVADLAKMPHLLIGGTTGSGKSVGVNGMLLSLLFTKSPEELRLLLIDPKKLEFEMYHDIPHLIHPVITDATQASAALAWACREMDERYEVLARWGVRNIEGFNAKVSAELRDWTPQKARQYAPKGWCEGDGPLATPAKLPYVVIVIDELADLMMVAKGDVETSIARIAQKARACGMHLIVATQRPSVDVVTGLIKANLPTRVAYTLRTRIDSRTILDEMGAESLLNYGDLLYLPPGVGTLMRAHAAFVSDSEVSRVTDFLRDQRAPSYVEGVTGASGKGDGGVGERDEMFDEAVGVCIKLGKASTSLVQRHLKIGYNRAANIVDQMEAAGVIGPADGAKAREVLITSAEAS